MNQNRIVPHMKWLIVQVMVALLLAGCSSSVPGGKAEEKAQTPTGALIRGQLSPDEYFGAVKKANEKERANEQFLMNREPTRAYNTKTGRFEYVPEGNSQSWNEETQRWEFTPITD